MRRTLRQRPRLNPIGLDTVVDDGRLFADLGEHDPDVVQRRRRHGRDPGCPVKSPLKDTAEFARTVQVAVQRDEGRRGRGCPGFQVHHDARAIEIGVHQIGFGLALDGGDSLEQLDVCLDVASAERLVYR